MIRKKLKESRENQTRRAETMEKNAHTKGECLNARPKEVNATIVESSTTLPNTAMSKPRQENVTGTRQADRKPA